MKRLHAISAQRLATKRLPGRSAVLRIGDEEDLLPDILDRDNAIIVKDFLFWDQLTGERAPTPEDAASIIDFCAEATERDDIDHIVAQCQAGAGRSVAVCMALSRMRGLEWPTPLAFNRTLYKMLLAQAGVDPEPEPLVSIALRVKYSADYFLQFMLGMQHQRYSNWEVVAFTDGLRPDIRQLVECSGEEGRLVLIENSEPKGRWGHPYRQAALELCRGEWIGTNNDDNQLSPGYIEQLVMAGQRMQAPLAVCMGSHRYSGWNVCPVGMDLAMWLARRELIHQCPWNETDFEADRRYLKRLYEAAGSRAAEIPSCLVIKN